MVNTKTVVKRVRILAPLWHQAHAFMPGFIGISMDSTMNTPSPRRAGRTLTQEEYEQLEYSGSFQGEQNNGRIQFGFLGGIGGVGVFGESPG